MLDLEFIEKNSALVEKAIRDKRIPSISVSELLALNEKRRSALTRANELKNRRNVESKRVPTLKDAAEKERLLSQLKLLQGEIKEADEEADALEAEVSKLLLRFPNVTDPDVPVGPDESGNVEIRRVGSVPHFPFAPLSHVEIGKRWDWFEFEAPARFSGARNYILKGDAALLELAVLRCAIDLAIRKGFTLMIPPVLVKYPAMEGTAYFPGGEEQAYEITKDGLYLIGTSEVPLMSIHMDQILEEKKLPLLYAGLSGCFRREAGTYGKDTAGLYRVHQFQKVEQVVLCRADPEESERFHQFILANAEELLQWLELPYRVVTVCTGDMGQGQRKKYDIETWMPSRNGYGETHSCSKFHDFQTRRLKIRYRTLSGEVVVAHSLNNTLIASPRILIALLENHQNPDGTVRVPQALQPYLGGRSLLGRP